MRPEPSGLAADPDRRPDVRGSKVILHLTESLQQDQQVLSVVIKSEMNKWCGLPEFDEFAPRLIPGASRSKNS